RPSRARRRRRRSGLPRAAPTPPRRPGRTPPRQAAPSARGGSCRATRGAARRGRAAPPRSRTRPRPRPGTPPTTSPRAGTLAGRAPVGSGRSIEHPDDPPRLVELADVELARFREPFPNHVLDQGHSVFASFVARERVPVDAFLDDEHDPTQSTVVAPLE